MSVCLCPSCVCLTYLCVRVRVCVVSLSQPSSGDIKKSIKKKGLPLVVRNPMTYFTKLLSFTKGVVYSPFQPGSSQMKIIILQCGLLTEKFAIFSLLWFNSNPSRFKLWYVRVIQMLRSKQHFGTTHARTHTRTRTPTCAHGHTHTLTRTHALTHPGMHSHTDVHTRTRTP